MTDNENILKNKTLAAFNRQAAFYDDTYNGRHAGTLYDVVLAKLDHVQYGSVLDVGCGTGTVLARIPERPGLYLAGIDLAPAMITVATERLAGRADLRNGDSEKLPWESEVFDRILCVDSFHHYPHPELSLQEMSRVMKPGGKLVLADPWFPSPLRQVFNLILPLGRDGDVRIYGKKEIGDLLHNAGFRMECWERFGAHSFVVTATTV